MQYSVQVDAAGNLLITPTCDGVTYIGAPANTILLQFVPREMLLRTDQMVNQIPVKRPADHKTLNSLMSNMVKSRQTPLKSWCMQVTKQVEGALTF